MYEEDNILIDGDEDVVDVWNNAFRIVEITFSSDNIKKGLSDSLAMVSAFTGASDIQIYKVSSNDQGQTNYVNLWENQKGIEFFYNDGKLNDGADRLNVSTKDNSYVVMLNNDDIIDERLKQKYLSVLDRAFKIIFEKLELEEKLVKANITDMLTQVGNRNYYANCIDDLSKQVGVEKTYSIIDLFKLKYVNDNYGHTFGDKYIIKVADLLKETLDSESMIFRIGGDEFVVLSLGNKKEQTEAMLEMVNMKLSEDTIGVSLPFPLYINYGVVEGVEDIQEQYLEADKIMMQHKSDTYVNLNIDRRR